MFVLCFFIRPLGLLTWYVLFYIHQKGKEADIVFLGTITDYEQLKTWAGDKCIPLVREITFENAEELTEEGLPFLLLFYNPSDKDSIEEYKTEVARQLVHEKGKSIANDKNTKNLTL